MRKFLTILFPNNVEGYVDFKNRFKDDLVELLCVANEDWNDFYILNNIIRNAKGKYVCVITKNEKVLDNFLDEVMNAIGADKDVIVYNTVDSKGDVTKYTSLIKGFKNFEKQENDIMGLQYFHIVKKRIANMVIFRDDHPLGAYGFYSKKVQSLCFTESLIRKELIMRDV